MATRGIHPQIKQFQIIVMTILVTIVSFLFRNAQGVPSKPDSNTRTLIDVLQDPMIGTVAVVKLIMTITGKKIKSFAARATTATTISKDVHPNPSKYLTVIIN